MKLSLLTRLIIMLMMLVCLQPLTVSAQNWEPPVAQEDMEDEDEDDDDDDDEDDEDDDDDDDDDERIDVDKLRFFFKANFPKIYDDLNAHVKKWEKDGKMTPIAEKIAETYFEMREIQETDPKFFKEYRDVTELELKSMFLGQTIRDMKTLKAKATEIEPKTTELKTLLTKLFNVKMEFEKKEIERVKTEVKEMEKRLERRLEKKDRIIRRRLDQLTGAEDDLEW